MNFELKWRCCALIAAEGDEKSCVGANGGVLRVEAAQQLIRLTDGPPVPSAES